MEINTAVLLAHDAAKTLQKEIDAAIALAVAAERERCARIAEASISSTCTWDACDMARTIAAAIRGEKS
jgi:pyruvoyl-dependent arginine decarboxylase (PvlArgDC)